MIVKKELPYPLDALEPYYNKETLDIHYNILYKGYVDNTNKTEEKLQEIPNEIKELLERRKTARLEKKWEESDRLRDKIKEMGYIVKDTKEGMNVEKI